MRRVQGIGGKDACQTQRELRTQLLSTKTFERDLTHDAWNWRLVLKALNSNQQQVIIGPGITKFAFCLLQHVMDHNYRKVDQGQKHVFEVTRVVGSTVHLYFHANGKWTLSISSEQWAARYSLPGRQAAQRKGPQMQGQCLLPTPFSHSIQASRV